MKLSPPARHSRETRVTAPLYLASIFASAFLLFLIQPMFAKMVLPKLGGAPAVWSVALVFFQALLLCGYAYAHLSTRYLPLPVAIAVHATLLCAAFFAQPIALPAGLAPSGNGQSWWLMLVFASTVGLPFFAVSATGPLLQAWFSRTSARSARNPYRLSTASNFGSFSGLLMYPFVVEPALRLGVQTRVWRIGFAMAGLGIILCGLLAYRAGCATGSPTARPSPLSLRTRLSWVALSFVPSGLLVAVTAHMTNDLGSAPFFWVMPLAAFLLTFVITFRDGAAKLNGTIVQLAPPWIAVMLVTVSASSAIGLLLSVHLVGFFLIALLCHGRLYAMRPAPGQLTEFHLLLSVGGVLGGVFAAIVSPALFGDLYEYPLLLCLGAACLPAARNIRTSRVIAETGAGLALISVSFVALRYWLQPAGKAVQAAGFLVLVLLLWVARKVPHRAALACCACAALAIAVARPRGECAVRSFFGVNRVGLSADGQFRTIVHGNTVHGSERVLRREEIDESQARPRPTSYYTDYGPITRALVAARHNAQSLTFRVGVGGLGAGTLACQSLAGEQWTFFEIDPSVVRIATEQFSFLKRCATHARIIEGDARLSLEHDSARYDVIVLDTFSSDSIPTHLMTREAMQLYAARLGDRGSIIYHVSNRFLRLDPVVVANAQSLGFHATVIEDAELPAADILEEVGFARSEIVVVNKSNADTSTFRRLAGARPPLPANPERVWTDDHANLLAAIIDKRSYAPGASARLAANDAAQESARTASNH